MIEFVTVGRVGDIPPGKDGWQYDLTSGTLVQDLTVGLTRHETRIVGGEIQVRLIPDVT